MLGKYNGITNKDRYRRGTIYLYKQGKRMFKRDFTRFPDC